MQEGRNGPWKKIGETKNVEFNVSQATNGPLLKTIFFRRGTSKKDMNTGKFLFD